MICREYISTGVHSSRVVIFSGTTRLWFESPKVEILSSTNLVCQLSSVEIMSKCIRLGFLWPVRSSLGTCRTIMLRLICCYRKLHLPHICTEIKTEWLLYFPLRYVILTHRGIHVFITRHAAHDTSNLLSLLQLHTADITLRVRFH